MNGQENEIMELARQAYENCDHIPDLKIPKEFVERFAKLVAAKEREACAKVCEDSVEYAGDTLARAIRARP